jgi:hypothetical protein
VVHHTTMEPGKLELLTGWLPRQPWWVGGDRPPQLATAGGFRLDDPQGEVGIEFIFATDVVDGQQVTYHVPLSYRGAPLAGAEPALLGTSLHGVHGRRWIHDGAHDPVVMAALDAFIHGHVQAQDQNRSDTIDRSVTCSGTPGADVVVDLVRVLRGDAAPSGGAAGEPAGYVEAGWLLPDGTAVRGPVALFR